MPIVGVVNQKGGVGKTTTAVNVAAVLAQSGQRTLLVDADPQGNATTGLGIEKAQLNSDLYAVLVAFGEANDPAAVQEALTPTGIDNLTLIGATLDLAGAETALANSVGREMVLREALSTIADQFDWIIIDAPPSLGLLTVNVLTASDWLIVPLQAEFYALEGLSQLIKTVERVQKRLNPRLSIGKVLLTMYDGRNRLSRQVADEVKAFFNGTVAETRIPRNVRLSEAPGFGQPAILLYPQSAGAEAYNAFVQELTR